MIDLTIETTASEEMRDFLDSAAWDRIVDIVAADCIPIRRALLTSYTLTDVQRIAHVAKLKAYRDLFEAIFKIARKSQLPSQYLELFTGAEKE